MREKPQFDILGKIDAEREARGWSEYTLAKNADITQSTISTWYRKGLQPSVASLEKICHAFGITLSEFFSDSPKTSTENNHSELHYYYDRLSPLQRETILMLLKSI